MFALGIRHTPRPARSVLSLALIAFALQLVSVGAFKKDVSADTNDPRSNAAASR
jgi:hypothetical protein